MSSDPNPPAEELTSEDMWSRDLRAVVDRIDVLSDLFERSPTLPVAVLGAVGQAVDTVGALRTRMLIERDGLLRDRADVERAKDALQKTLDLLKLAVEAQKDSAGVTNASSTQQMSDLEALEEQIKKVVKRIDDELLNPEVIKSLKTLADNAGKSEDKIAKLTLDLDGSTRAHQSTQDDLTTSRQTISTLEDEVRSLKASLATANAQTAEATESRENAESARAERDRFEADVKRLRHQVSDLETTCNTIRDNAANAAESQSSRDNAAANIRIANLETDVTEAADRASRADTSRGDMEAAQRC